MLVLALMPAFASTSVGDIVDRHRQAFADLPDDALATRCEPVLQGFFDELEAVRPTDVDPAEVSTRGAALIDDIFAFRLEVHGRLQDLYDDNALSSGCIRGARRADLAGRYLQDALYVALDREDAAPAPWLVAPGADAPATLPSLDSILPVLETGDVLVTRGTALSSAGIAHMGRLDGQFSHNALIHQASDGDLHTVEAYLERGALTQPVPKFLHHDLGRIVVMRYRGEPGRARLAARRAWDRIANGPPMDYDAQFDSDDHRALFCSEVARWAFTGNLDDGPTGVPYDLTVFDKERNATLFEAMSIEVDVTSAPVDMLYAPRFDIVAEWRDPEMLDTMRRHDVVVESMFSWMEDLDYVLESTGFDRFFVGMDLAARQVGFFPKRIHPNGDRRFLVPSLTLQTAGLALFEVFDERLEGRDAQSMTYAELRAILEEIRKEDEAEWRAGAPTIFHDRLHPAVVE